MYPSYISQRIKIINLGQGYRLKFYFNKFTNDFIKCDIEFEEWDEIWVLVPKEKLTPLESALFQELVEEYLSSWN